MHFAVFNSVSRKREEERGRERKRDGIYSVFLPSIFFMAMAIKMEPNTHNRVPR